MTSVRNCKLVQKLVMTAVVLGASAVSRHAQNAYPGKFTLAAEAHWGGVALPVGDYTFVLPSKSAPYRLYVQGEGVGAIITAAGVETMPPAMPKSELSGSKTSVEVQNTTH